MGDIKDFLMFTLKVAGAILVISQVPAVGAVINKNYFSS